MMKLQKKKIYGQTSSRKHVNINDIVVNIIYDNYIIKLLRISSGEFLNLLYKFKPTCTKPRHFLKFSCEVGNESNLLTIE